MLTKNHEKLTSEVKAHVAADAVRAGRYWRPNHNDVGGIGCFIGCLAHSNGASKLGDLYGLPLPLVEIAENIFEALPKDEGVKFFADIPDAVGRDGKDLTRIHWAFLAAELRALPEVMAEAKSAVDAVIVGMDILANGGEWDKDAAAAAAHAAHAARAAYAAAAAAAGAGADAASYAAGAHAGDAAGYARAGYAHAAAAACRTRQAATLLRLIGEAK